MIATLSRDSKRRLRPEPVAQAGVGETQALRSPGTCNSPSSTDRELHTIAKNVCSFRIHLSRPRGFQSVVITRSFSLKQFVFAALISFFCARNANAQFYATPPQFDVGFGVGTLLAPSSASATGN